MVVLQRKTDLFQVIAALRSTSGSPGGVVRGAVPTDAVRGRFARFLTGLKKVQYKTFNLKGA